VNPTSPSPASPERLGKTGGLTFDLCPNPHTTGVTPVVKPNSKGNCCDGFLPKLQSYGEKVITSFTVDKLLAKNHYDLHFEVEGRTFTFGRSIVGD